jgi:prepilin-type N-terminal cleavage/methylation domain-containing protein
MQIKQSRRQGFTLVEIMIVVAIIGLLAAIAIPNFVRARQTSQTNACINNLRQIDGAIQQWALENHKQGTDGVTLANLTGFLGRSASAAINVDITCPAGGAYAVTTVDASPTCDGPATHTLATPAP